MNDYQRLLNAQEELEQLEQELEAVSAMSEEQACTLYNVDKKSEIITILNEEIDINKSYLIQVA